MSIAPLSTHCLPAQACNNILQGNPYQYCFQPYELRQIETCKTAPLASTWDSPVSLCITSSSHTVITVGVTEASFEQSESGGVVEVCLNITNGRLEIGVSSSVYTQSVTATGIYFVLVHSSIQCQLQV